jgi:hypothetical protein
MCPKSETGVLQDGKKMIEKGDLQQFRETEKRRQNRP